VARTGKEESATMKRLSLAALALMALAAPEALAQPRVGQRPPVNQFQRPPVSPSLNLLRGGNPGVNYYTLVRPQVDTNRALLQLQQQQLALSQAGQPLAPMMLGSGAALGDLPITGHPVGFWNYGRYYPLLSGSGGGGTTALGGVRR
jgi:hypothetical protein